MKKKQPLVGILMGSDSDVLVMGEAAKILDDFNVPHEQVITSAHRSPKRTMLYAESASKRGIKILIAGAGYAAHLAGVVAAQTVLPVIGVPIDSSSLKGLDAILSTVQMPGGIPVATMSIGKAGAKNAALMAVAILALSNQTLKKSLESYRRKLEKGILKKNKKLQSKNL
ncbi:MAG: 5-(carboxyamino)imidazole ribonucleotide mutase [Deltaproteobacteria bacterium RIFCSPLOWO2_02_FULL_50_16]|nr:MAG: 5-(carboxyamino)imidazole ribonucleotide mutase [Deltaproteobacteria bacterium GWA2_50_8]OGQ26633.1 MAG: 5-(carboxyamino)imidazole ribonucleotide mutase [Deltaproteobacteria bacterium RIFCSPHIGHO2_02_FULL_50_15]OGQ57749.1 MAG: 5-(carboxyamino)imidazole ribonucleotide mutase [Deltaproteobacteria bacterium RIFCSPLOWO2_02_FULL_50_16]OGQ68790.1 MAG: 5-(carboxyamino)imidazole ribonucleotide mutase [Deltaproteobacteria bacterium RIFCSPLOWO2_12_FULL_50_11]